jgi:hypothetical protein
VFGQAAGRAGRLDDIAAIATARTSTLLTAHGPRDAALTAGFRRALLACAAFLLAAAVIALRATNARGELATHEAAQQASSADQTRTFGWFPSSAGPASLGLRLRRSDDLERSLISLSAFVRKVLGHDR